MHIKYSWKHTSSPLPPSSLELKGLKLVGLTIGFEILGVSPFAGAWPSSLRDRYEHWACAEATPQNAMPCHALPCHAHGPCCAMLVVMAMAMAMGMAMGMAIGMA